MGYSSYIGRVGGLAVALGIGIAIGAPSGVASATPADSATAPATDAGTDDQRSDPDPSTAISPKTDHSDDPSEPHHQQPADKQPDPKSPSSSTVAAAPGVTVSSSGGAHTSGTVKKATKKAVTTARVTAQTNTSQAASETRDPVSATTQDTAAATLIDAQPVSAKPKPSPVTVMISRAVAPIVSSILEAIPRIPAESPLAWIFAAAARRQIGVPEPESVQPTTLAATTAIIANQPPTVNTVFDTPNATTGVITGQVVGTDPEGQPVTYALSAAPTTGTLVFDSATAKFTYTPTTAQRIGAGVTAIVDTIAMTVTVSDGVNSVPAVVNIPISPTSITKSADIGAVDEAHAVVATATRAYITNRSAGTVTVIDTTTNSVIGTIAVGPTPDALVIKPDGTKLYVTSVDNNTVTVVDVATSAITATITIAKPSAIAINSSGSTLYVASRDAGTVTKIATATNTTAGAVTLPAGSVPTGIVVSPDKTKIYVMSNTATGGGTIAVFGYTSTTVTTIANLTSAPTGLAVTPDNKRVYFSTADAKLSVYDTTTRAIATRPLQGVPAALTMSKDGSALFVTDTVGRVWTLNTATGSVQSYYLTRISTAAMSVTPGTAISPDGMKLYVTDYDADKVYAATLIPPNNAPIVGAPTFNPPNTTTGAVTGTVGVKDPDGDPLAYTVTAKPTKGTLSLKADGTFTYTPTSSARHAAAADNAQPPVTTDSFTISVSDGRGGVVTRTVTVNILPANKVPTYTLTVGTPNTTTGVVTGKVTASDADFDVRTFTVSTPARGAVAVTSTGSFTYTPTAAARHAAAKLGATTEKTDTFTITIDDGHGGVVPVSVTVTISPTNSAPTGATVGNITVDLNNGVVTGTVTASDTNNDQLSFTSTTPAKGTLVFGANGTFTYTPTEAARHAAAVPGADPAAKVDPVTITVSDGYGGTTTVSVNLTVTPWGNTAPTNGHAVAGDPNMAIGEIRGTLKADDAEDETLTYVLASGPSRGVVNIDPSGTFRYVPNVEARWGAATTSFVDTDTFSVTVSDGNGGATTFDVHVTIAPPDASAAATDQRGTTVAVNVQEMYFYSQSQTNKALDLLKADGVDTIRILIPWAGVEASNDVWTWSAVDRVVNSAVARDMKVIGILNSPPDWAMVPGSPSLGGPPADPAEYAEFASMVATRYADKVSAYEVWNEPNYYKFWAPTPDAAAYTALLKVAYAAIKAADPDAVVVAGGIAATPDNGTQMVDAVRYVSEMYEAGAAGYFDALSFHPYHYYLKFSQGGGFPSSPLTMVNAIHDVMVANGDGNKKIWATEYGEPSSLGGDAVQAAYIDDFLRTWRDLDYAGPAYIHTVRDYFSLDPIAASFGIYNQDWTPKLAADVIETVIDENEAFLAGGGGIEL